MVCDAKFSRKRDRILELIATARPPSTRVGLSVVRVLIRPIGE